MIDRLQQNVLKTLQVYCIYSGTVVPAQYGGLCCLFAPRCLSVLVDRYTSSFFPLHLICLCERILVSWINFVL